MSDQGRGRGRGYGGPQGEGQRGGGGSAVGGKGYSAGGRGGAPRGRGAAREGYGEERQEHAFEASAGAGPAGPTPIASPRSSLPHTPRGEAGPSAVETKEATFPTPARSRESTVAIRQQGPGFQQATGRVFALRPTYGSLGTKAQLSSNYFAIRNAPSMEVFHYDVTVNDKNGREIEIMRRNRGIIEELFNKNRGVVAQDVLYAYDGRKNLYTTGQLRFPGGAREYSRPVTVEKGDSAGEYTVILQPTDPPTVSLSQFATYLSPDIPAASREVPLLSLTILDLFLRQNALRSATTHLIGRSLFTPANAVSIGGGLEIWRGVFQSARLTEGSGVYPTSGAKAKKNGLLMINVDISFTSVFKAQDVLAFMREVIPQSTPDRKLNAGERRTLEMRLRSAKVELLHRKVGSNGNDYVKKVIRGVSDKSAAELKFDHNGTTISVADYFMKTYNMRLRFPNINLLRSSGPQGDTFFPMEVCRITEGNRYTGEMSGNDRSGMIKASTQRPQDKKQAIEKAMVSLDLKNNPHLKALDVDVDNRMVRVDARVLSQPMLAYGRGKQVDPRGGAWNLIRTAYFAPAAMPSYGYVLMCGERDMDEGALWNFDTELRGIWSETGMQIGNAEEVAYVRMGREVNRQSLLSAVHNVQQRCTQVFQGKPPVVIMFIVNVRHTYELTKTVMDREVGMPSQVMQARNCKSPNRSRLQQYLANVSLKVNTKLGGINQRLLEPPAEFVKGLDTFVVGADVTHFTRSDDMPSIAAVVSTIDPPLTKYFPTVRLQSNKTEVIEDMQGIMKDTLIAYYRANQSRKPQRILFYRDGVSEGQFQTVFDSEIKAVKRACQSLEQGYNPKITFTVMTKRHKTKIFVDNPGPNNTDRSGNAMPGTVVDTTITHPYEFDFFLMSHAGIQGTSRPAHYYVLLDENGLSADVMQQFTYRLCYVYTRATRSVSLVPPTYYAHLLAYRVRLYVNQGHTDIAVHKNLVPAMGGKVTAADFAKTMFYV